MNALDRLEGTGVFDDTVVGTKAMTEVLAVDWRIKSNENEGQGNLDVSNSYFSWRFCHIVGWFHGCFKPPLKMMIIGKNNHNTGSSE